ncbi:MAG: SPOR domain-containing protein, partial [Methylovirgula sp.]
ASVANKSVYRVRVVGLSHAEATALCEKLQAKGGSCFVAKNN